MYYKYKPHYHIVNIYKANFYMFFIYIFFLHIHIFPYNFITFSCHCIAVSKLSFVLWLLLLLFTFGSFIGIAYKRTAKTATHKGPCKHTHTDTQVKIHFITPDSYFQYITRGIKGKSALARSLFALYIRIAERMSVCAFHTKKRINKDPSERKITVMWLVVRQDLFLSCVVVSQHRSLARPFGGCFFFCFCFLCIKSA